MYGMLLTQMGVCKQDAASEVDEEEETKSQINAEPATPIAGFPDGSDSAPCR